MRNYKLSFSLFVVASGLLFASLLSAQTPTPTATPSPTPTPTATPYLIFKDQPQKTDGVNILLQRQATSLSNMEIAIGSASDAAGAPTVIGLLKQIAANTAPP
jgi:hypothetical protein